jgi:hypothetical protein
MFNSDVSITFFVSVLSMVAIWVPLFKGGKLALQGLGVTRRLNSGEIERQVRQGSNGGPQSVTVHMLLVLRKALREGTTCGLLILFLSMRIANDSLEMGALALALTSSIFALIGYAALEGFKIRLYHRMISRIDDALIFYRNAAPHARGEEVPAHA